MSEIYKQGHPRFYELLETLRTESTEPRFQKLLDGMAEVHARKNAGYAGKGTSDPLANFRMCEKFGIPAWLGGLVRWTDKLIRIQNLAKNPASDMVGESILDTLTDLGNYSLLIIVMIEELVGQSYSFGELHNEHTLPDMVYHAEQLFKLVLMESNEYYAICYWLLWFAKAAMLSVITLEGNTTLELSWLEEVSYENS